MENIICGKYKILKRIGKGGDGIVFLAENITLGNIWAIKRFEKSSLDEKTFIEPHILKNLNHPSLPRIVDLLEDENYFYLVEDYIKGISLEKYLEKTGSIDPEQALEWGIQLCEALSYLHAFEPKIIYRDLKPSNIIITPAGKPVLIDFGIARLFKSDSSNDTVYIGTRGYAAPEQYGLGQSSPATDIYSLGITLIHAITGIHPTSPEFKTAKTGISTDLWNILEKCTSTDPSMRFSSAEELKELLKEIALKKINIYHNTQVNSNTRSFVIAGHSGTGSSTVTLALKELLIQRNKIALIDLCKNKGLTKMLTDTNQFEEMKIDSKLTLYKFDDSLPIEDLVIKLDKIKYSNDLILVNSHLDINHTILKLFDQLLLVRDMNILHNRYYKEFIQSLQSSDFNFHKMSIIINKFIKCKISPNDLLKPLEVPLRSKYFLMPFETENYRSFIDNMKYIPFRMTNTTELFRSSLESITNYYTFPNSFKRRYFSKILNFFKKRDVK